jgi:hypothetical protein
MSTPAAQVRLSSGAAPAPGAAAACAWLIDAGGWRRRLLMVLVFVLAGSMV